MCKDQVIRLSCQSILPQCRIPAPRSLETHSIKMDFQRRTAVREMSFSMGEWFKPNATLTPMTIADKWGLPYGSVCCSLHFSFKDSPQILAQALCFRNSAKNSQSFPAQAVSLHVVTTATTESTARTPFGPKVNCG